VQYEQLKYVPESEDPSITVETAELVAKIIDNTGLSLPATDAKPLFEQYAGRCIAPFSHHLGYHGIRTLYHKQERRNLVLAFASWMNLQGAHLEGIETDPVDERAAWGVGRGWPVRMEPKGAGVVLRIDPMPRTQFAYSIEFQPAEPDGIDFFVRFRFGRRPKEGKALFHASWPCYISAADDVRLFYPQGTPEDFTWTGLGEKPDILLGETVGYEHRQQGFHTERQALPLAYGHLNKRALVLMFSGPAVQPFVVNAGGHWGYSATQNPAWDFEYTIEDYPLDDEVGFDGRLIYTPFAGPDAVLARYCQWLDGRA